MNSSAGKRQKEFKVLFISQRDACRGPMAECIFQMLADKYAMKSFNKFLWKATSAGLEKYNQGNLPDQMCLKVLGDNYLDSKHACRQASVTPGTLTGQN